MFIMTEIGVVQAESFLFLQDYLHTYIGTVWPIARFYFQCLRDKPRALHLQNKWKVSTQLQVSEDLGVIIV